MVAERREIPADRLQHSRCIIRDFDGRKALKGGRKDARRRPPARSSKGFAGKPRSEAHMQYHYVPSDKGRFSNTMEYSYDDWTVGQLALALGDDAAWRTFNDRGYWWRNVISDAGYCHLRDSGGPLADPFDPFRSGAQPPLCRGATPGGFTFFVPQDVPALVRQIGRRRFLERLE